MESAKEGQKTAWTEEEWERVIFSMAAEMEPSFGSSKIENQELDPANPQEIFKKSEGE